MKKIWQMLREHQPSLQRGDGGTIYIVFIMAIIIMASYVMVNGLMPTFEESNAVATNQNPDDSTNFIEGPGGLPSLAPRGSEEYRRQRRCAQEAEKGLSNKRIKQKGSVTVEC